MNIRDEDIRCLKLCAKNLYEKIMYMEIFGTQQKIIDEKNNSSCFAPYNFNLQQKKEEKELVEDTKDLKIWMSPASIEQYFKCISSSYATEIFRRYRFFFEGYYKEAGRSFLLLAERFVEFLESNNGGHSRLRAKYRSEKEVNSFIINILKKIEAKKND